MFLQEDELTDFSPWEMNPSSCVAVIWVQVALEDTKKLLVSG